MVPRKSWVSESFSPISESRQRFYRVSEARFFLVWFRNRSSLRLGFSNKGLGKSWILPFSTPRPCMKGGYSLGRVGTPPTCGLYGDVLLYRAWSLPFESGRGSTNQCFRLDQVYSSPILTLEQGRKFSVRVTLQTNTFTPLGLLHVYSSTPFLIASSLEQGTIFTILICQEKGHVPRLSEAHRTPHTKLGYPGYIIKLLLTALVHQPWQECEQVANIFLQ